MVGFGLRVDHRAADTTGELAVDALERVGVGVVEAQIGLEAFGKVGKTARDQHRDDARRLERTDQLARTGVEPQPIAVHRVERVGAEAFEQGDAAIERLAKVDFATHGRFGDLGHLGLFAALVGDLVDALDVDQRGVHVGHEQAEVVQTSAGRHKSKVHTRRVA